MLIPEAWRGEMNNVSGDRREFYDYHASLVEPWDGPALVAATDGERIGAVLDRNGLRPSRYTITDDGLVVLASETGVLDLDPARVNEKGRLQPGRMFLVDLDEHRRVTDEEIKQRMSERKPYGEWLSDNMRRLAELPEADRDAVPAPAEGDALRTRQQLFGYTREDLKLMMQPMGADGKDPTGSMGDDTPLAVLSDRSRMLYDYFKQLFAQVTNPPLDSIREELVTSLYTHLGSEEDWFEETPAHCRQLRVDQPIIGSDDLQPLHATPSEPSVDL